MKPLISIIIPAYNSELYIASTIRSLHSQYLKDFELIIINDASTDNTEHLIKSLIQIYELAEKTVYIKNPVNYGCATSRNIGIHIARGQFICFLDADDNYKPDFLSKLSNKLMNDHSDFVFCGYDTNFLDYNKYKKYTNSRIYPKSTRRFHIICLYMLGHLHIGHWAAMYNLSFIRNNYIFYFDGCKKAADTEFVIRVLNHSKKISFVKESLYIYMSHKNSITTSMPSSDLFDGYYAYNRAFHCIRNPFYKILYYFTKYPRETYIILERFYTEQVELPYLYCSKYKILMHCILNVLINKKNLSKDILNWYWCTYLK